jgi:hypothetical protein
MDAVPAPCSRNAAAAAYGTSVLRRKGSVAGLIAVRTLAGSGTIWRVAAPAMSVSAAATGSIVRDSRSAGFAAP